MFSFARTLVVDLPPPEAWENLRDLVSVAQCMPHLSEIQRQSRDAITARLHGRAGLQSLSGAVQMHIVQACRPSSLRIRGLVRLDDAVDETARFDVAWFLEPTPAGTRATYVLGLRASRTQEWLAGMVVPRKAQSLERRVAAVIARRRGRQAA